MRCACDHSIRPTSWQGTPLGQLQGLPKDAKPVSVWRNKDEAFLSIVEGVRSIVQEYMRTGMALPKLLPIRNSSFEVWKDGAPAEWFCKATTGWISQVQDMEASGNKVLEIGGNTDNKEWVFCRTRETQSIPILPNSQLKLSFRAKKVEEGMNPQRKKYVELFYHDGSGWTWGFGKDVTDTQWTLYETEWWYLPVNAQQVSVGVVVEKDGAFRIDGVELHMRMH